MKEKIFTTNNTKVKNCEGTATDKHPDNISWLDALHLAFQRKSFPRCFVKGHPEHVDKSCTVGAHVHIVGESKQYIIPMCKYHNGQKPEVELTLLDNKEILPKSELIKATKKK